MPSMGKSAAPDPSVFIIESLSFEDERQERREGHLLYEMLNLVGKSPEYRYIRTKRELVAMLGQFHDIGKRYLHISCHGNEEGLGLTLEGLSFAEFGDIARPHLRDRRLFLSACSVARQELAQSIMSRAGCYSVTAPIHDINFSDAAIMWASYYHLVFKENRNSMNHTRVSGALQKASDTFATPIKHYRRSKKHPYFTASEFWPDM